MSLGKTPYTQLKQLLNKTEQLFHLDHFQNCYFHICIRQSLIFGRGTLGHYASFKGCAHKGVNPFMGFISHKTWSWQWFCLWLFQKRPCPAMPPAENMVNFMVPNHVDPDHPPASLLAISQGSPTRAGASLTAHVMTGPTATPALCHPST